MRTKNSFNQGRQPSRLKRRLVPWLLALTASATVSAAPLSFQTDTKRVSLLELYTSEGCSSCPPAESWLARQKDSPNLWKTFAPVAFHVDYWNGLGWKDRWSSSEFTDRQQSYAQLWKSENVYTPCFVRDGQEWHGWLYGGSPAGAPDENVGVLSVVSSDTNLWTAVFVPVHPSASGYEIHAALLAGGLGSDVRAGENNGRHLLHEFTGLNLIQGAMKFDHGVATGKFITDTSRRVSEKQLALTVWVTRAGELEPLQATGGWLTSPAHPTP